MTNKISNSRSEYAVILTACIDPSGGKIQVYRNEPSVRMQDYVRALIFWLELEDPRINKIIFVDNSGYPLEKIEETTRDFNQFNKEVEIVSLNDNYYPEGIHYGYAELSMIDRVFASSELVKKSDYIIKATGRLMFPNIQKLIHRLPDDYMFAVDCRNNTLFVNGYNQIFVTTQLMIISTSFYRDILFNVKSELSPSIAWIESLLYQKFLLFKDREGAILRWPINVDPVGYAAHWHKQYHSPKQQAINILRALCRVILPNWWV